jgi:hypothetical protein
MAKGGPSQGQLRFSMRERSCSDQATSGQSSDRASVYNLHEKRLASHSDKVVKNLRNAGLIRKVGSDGDSS